MKLCTTLLVFILVSVAQGQHNSIGRICGRSNCAMCNYLHTLHAHGVDAYNYNNSWDIHRSLHAPKIKKPVPLKEARLPFDPTPHSELNALIRLINPQPDDVIYDPGCGDARLLIALCRDTDAKGVGIEIDPRIADLARKEVAAAGLESQITIWNLDVRTVNLDRATVIIFYLFPDLIKELDLSKAKLVASYMHEIPGERNVVQGNWYVIVPGRP